MMIAQPHLPLDKVFSYHDQPLLGADLETQAESHKCGLSVICAMEQKALCRSPGSTDALFLYTSVCVWLLYNASGRVSELIGRGERGSWGSKPQPKCRVTDHTFSLCLPPAVSKPE